MLIVFGLLNAVNISLLSILFLAVDDCNKESFFLLFYAENKLA